MKFYAVRSLCALLAASALLAAAPAPTSINADYPVPAPLPSGAPGTLLWQRSLHNGAAIPEAARNILLLYTTVSATGERVAVSGTLAIPPGTAPKGGWPIISWAHGTTGNAPRCAPSRDDTPNVEQRMLAAWVHAGYAVAQTDYEGEATPGIHPYLVAAASAHDLTDIVRAARQIDPQIGRQWIVMGHSEGGTAAIATAGAGQAWAPRLQLVGAVSYAPASHIALVLNSMAHSNRASRSLPLLAMMVEGIASADPMIDLARILSPTALQHQPELQMHCAGALMRNLWWATTPTNQYFRSPGAVERLLPDFKRNDPGRLNPAVPLLLVQGSRDSMVGPSMTADLSGQLCQRGANLALRSVVGATHDSVLRESVPAVLRWVADRFAGRPAHSTCNNSGFL